MKQFRPAQELNETGFRALIEHSHEGIVIYDITGKIRFASKGTYKIGGYSEAETLQRKGASFLHPSNRSEARKTFYELLTKAGKSATLVQRLRHKHGHYIWIESRLTNFSHIPEINGIVSNFRDITEKKIAEERAFQSQELLAAINRNLTEGIYMGVVKSTFIYVNDAFYKMFGFKNFNDLIKKKIRFLYAIESDRRKVFQELRNKGECLAFKSKFRKKNGEVFWGILNIRLLSHEGKANYFVGTVRDISKEKEAEEALMESRTFLNNIIDSVEAPIFVKNESNTFHLINKKFASLINLPKDEIIGKSGKNIFDAKTFKFISNCDNQILKTGKTYSGEDNVKLSSGASHSVLLIKSRYVNEKGEKFLIGFIADITHLRRAEEEINKLNANLSGVLESTKESVYAVDSQFNYVTFNQNHKKVMKVLYHQNIAVGGNKLQYLKGSKDYAWVKSEIEKALGGSYFVSEHHLNHVKLKGYIRTTYNPIRNQRGEVVGAAVFVNDITQRRQYEEIIKSINANLRGVLESTTDQVFAVDRNYHYIMFNNAHAGVFLTVAGVPCKVGYPLLKGFPRDVVKKIRAQIQLSFSGKHFSFEYTLQNKHVEVSLNPIKSDRKLITGVAVFIRDITERKNIEVKFQNLNNELVNQNVQLASQEDELKKTLEELSERNFELDQLMYKTSHDLRSPLSSIMGLINLIHLDSNPENRMVYMGKIEGRIKKLDEFIRSMLNYARVNRLENSVEEIDLEKVAKSCVRELENLDNFQAINISIQSKGKVRFYSDALRVHIIFSNIISNAYKYFNEDAQSFLKIRINKQNETTTLTFEDNGIGIKQEYLDKIFNMFYRATDRSEGSGLGMYIVKQAVEKLSGTIKIKSEYGVGTQITITLPNNNYGYTS